MVKYRVPEIKLAHLDVPVPYEAHHSRYSQVIIFAHFVFIKSVTNTPENFVHKLELSSGMPEPTAGSSLLSNLTKKRQKL